MAAIVASFFWLPLELPSQKPTAVPAFAPAMPSRMPSDGSLVSHATTMAARNTSRTMIETATGPQSATRDAAVGPDGVVALGAGGMVVPLLRYPPPSQSAG